MFWWSLVLFLVAVLGHFLLGLRIYNWFYGAIVDEHRSDAIRGVWTVFLIAVPLGYWFVHGWDGLAPLEQGVASLTAGYLLVCWFIALVYLPAITLWRLIRRPPPALGSNHTKTLDFAAELKTPIVGSLKKRLLASLPGNEVFQADFQEKTLHLPTLPEAWNGLTILHLSDLHMCGTPEMDYFQRVIAISRDWRPDLVVITGDVVDSATHHRWVLRVLGELRGTIAAFAILGNHDYRYDVKKIRKRLHRAGLRVLINSWETIEVRGQPLTVIGHEGPWLTPPPDLTECPANGFRLCLSHTPDNIGWARKNGVDLMLSGHVHGGQIRLPVFGSVFVPSRFGRRYDCGVFVEGPTTLHVSRGLGAEHPVRFNCRPEVTLLRLSARPETKR